uniref:G_PROTEIN_RECEP_F1_2 domain-containing protein n=1 Tax=Heterorhabditis bacteriophora TaxID=37862 RepID=A0A1I7X9Z7_HETBA
MAEYSAIIPDNMPEEDYDWWQENCAIIPPETSRCIFDFKEFSFRLILVGVVGALIACVSVLFNTFLFCILVRNKRHRSSHLIYLTFLALADTFLSGIYISIKIKCNVKNGKWYSAAYILLFPVNLYMDYFSSEWLAAAWWSYMRVIITTSHVFISVSAFLIVAAAFERYLSIAKIHNQFARHHRLVICAAALIFALIAKFPMYFEVEYWFRNIITIFLPFLFCFYLNFEIIRRLRLQLQGAKLFRFTTSEHRQNIRSATLMLVFVTCTYLASNVLNVIVCTWEFFDKHSLMSENLRPFYTLSSDLISLLTVMASACRLPIYIACNVRIRCEVLDCIDSCIHLQLKMKPYKVKIHYINRVKCQ